MKFKAQAAGLLSGIKPMIAIATKGIQGDYAKANLITLKVLINHIEVIADGGHVNASSEISNDTHKLDYSCENDGVVTVSANDFINSLSSFPSASLLSFQLIDNVGGRELKMSDNEEFQTLPVHNQHCEYTEPFTDNKDVVSVTLRRDAFISYANKISFAHGDFEKCKEYKYWVLQAIKENEIRFVSGSGMRFAVVELIGNNISDAKDVSTILFPNDQTQPILNVLESLSCQDVTIKSKDRNIAIYCNNTKICIYTCDPDIVWPNIDTILRRSSKFIFTTKIYNWKNSVKGILATCNDSARKENKSLNCSLNIDLDKKVVQMNSNMTLKSSRKVFIDDIATNETQKNIVVNCAIAYLNEVVSHGSDDGYLQFEIENSQSPIVIRHYSSSGTGDPLGFFKPVNDGTNERYTIFFATVKN